MLKRLPAQLMLIALLALFSSCGKEPIETPYQYKITQAICSSEDQAAFESYVEDNGIPLGVKFTLSGDSQQQNDLDAISQFNIVTSDFNEDDIDELIQSSATLSVSLIPFYGSDSDALATYTYSK